MTKTAQTMQLSRRSALRMGAAGSMLGAAAFAVPGLAQASGPGSAQVAKIYQLQAAFHRAKTFQDIDLMMSLWASDATLTIAGDPNSPYTGSGQVRAFFLRSGSFTHRRFSLVPSFKISIDVHGDTAFLYFECHDVGDYGLTTRFIASDTFLAGTIRNIGGDWVFANMAAGPAAPLSAGHYYFP